MDKQKYARQRLQKMAREVALSLNGTRNNNLFDAALKAGSYAKDGSLDLMTARDKLVAAAVEAGLPPMEANQTVLSALESSDPSHAWYPQNQLEAKRAKRSKRRQALPVRHEQATTAYTIFENLKSVDGRWCGNASHMVSSRVESPARGHTKQTMPLWSFAKFEHDSRARGNQVLEVYALVLDYDNDPNFSMGQVGAWWNGCAFVAHTSLSHNVDKDGQGLVPRGRVIVPFSRPATPDEYNILAEWALNSGRGKFEAKEVHTIARAYFLPCEGPGGYDSLVRLDAPVLDIDEVLRNEALLESDPELAEPDPRVWDSLDKAGEKVKKCIANLDRVLRGDARTPVVEKCLLRNKVLIDGYEISDDRVTQLRLWIDYVYGLSVPKEDIERVLEVVAQEREVHPVREWLESLRWDGRERIANLLPYYLSCEDSGEGMLEVYGVKWLMAAVARAMVPGCKVDSMLVLQGSQGEGKSSAISALVGDDWFGDNAIDVKSRDGSIGLQGKWVVEWGELSGMRRTTVEAVKRFLTLQFDDFRPVHGRHNIKLPRTCVFIGTTNENRFLADPTGSRRFWVATVAADIRGDELYEDREQLWAEAYARLKTGMDSIELSWERAREMSSSEFRVRTLALPDDSKWWLTKEEEARREQIAEGYTVEDPIDAVLDDVLETYTWIGVKDLLQRLSANNIDVQAQSQYKSRLVPAMERRGWERNKSTKGRGWRPIQGE